MHMEYSQGEDKSQTNGTKLQLSLGVVNCYQQHSLTVEKKKLKRNEKVLPL